MRAVRWSGKFDVRVEEVPPPQIVNPTFVITHRLPLNEARNGYAIFNERLKGCLKVLLKP